MTTTVRIGCPDCGAESEVNAQDVSMHLCAGHPERSYWCFPCDGCGQRKSMHADWLMVSMLRAAKVPTVLWTLPVEVHVGGPPLTKDDWLDFALHLGMRDDLAAVASS